MTLATLLSLKTLESLQNRVVTPLFSPRTKLLALSQIGHSVDADIWCKRALRFSLAQRPMALSTPFEKELNPFVNVITMQNWHYSSSFQKVHFFKGLKTFWMLRFEVTFCLCRLIHLRQQEVKQQYIRSFWITFSTPGKSYCTASKYQLVLQQNSMLGENGSIFLTVLCG